jgi:secretion/DNA translocation related TadE-like protein
MRGRALRGSAAVLVVSLMSLLVAVGLLGTAVGGVVADQRRAESAADLAALAGAAAAQAGQDACSAAAVVARRNGALLDRCGAAGAVVTLRVRRPTRLAMLRLIGSGLTVRAEARAGPVGAASA